MLSSSNLTVEPFSDAVIIDFIQLDTEKWCTIYLEKNTSVEIGVVETSIAIIHNVMFTTKLYSHPDSDPLNGVFRTERNEPRTTVILQSLMVLKPTVISFFTLSAPEHHTRRAKHNQVSAVSKSGIEQQQSIEGNDRK